MKRSPGVKAVEAAVVVAVVKGALGDIPIEHCVEPVSVGEHVRSGARTRLFTGSRMRPAAAGRLRRTVPDLQFRELVCLYS